MFHNYIYIYIICIYIYIYIYIYVYARINKIMINIAVNVNVNAAGLCARVRACAGAAESLHTYIHTCESCCVQSPMLMIVVVIFFMCHNMSHIYI